MIGIAAVGDVHLGEESKGQVRPAHEGTADVADELLLAGDPTRTGIRAWTSDHLCRRRDANGDPRTDRRRRERRSCSTTFGHEVRAWCGVIRGN